jgi:TPR repeat protein
MLYLSGAMATAPSAGWLAEAAGGTGAALANARLLYPQGIDVDRDPARAFAWSSKAAAQGLACAAANLGMLYARGIGCEQDFAAAVAWYRRAADAGDAAGALGLGLMHENGLGVAKDRAAAAGWYERAAAQGNDMAATALALLQLDGEPGNPAEAARLLAGPATRGNAFAQHRLGLLHAEGLGVPRDLGRARHWLGRAARQGHAASAAALARLEAELATPRTA